MPNIFNILIPDNLNYFNKEFFIHLVYFSIRN